MKLYQLSKTGKIKFLNLTTDGAKLITEHGVIGEKEREPVVKVCKPMNKGKKNELTAAEQAIAEMKAKVVLKMKEGYSKEKPVANTTERTTSGNTSIDLGNIPSPFCPCKPISDCPKSVLESSSTIAQRKHNGHCVFLVKTSRSEKIYSRRMEDITAVCKELPPINRQMALLDAGDFVLSEFVFHHTKLNKEVPRFVAQVIRHEIPSIALERYNTLSKEGTFHCYPFDILFRKNSFTGDMNYTDRHAILGAMKLEDVPELLEWKGPNSDLVKRAKEEMWEGFVLRTKDAKSHISYSMDGKAHRAGSYKYKFTKTGDYIVDEAIKGKSGKHSHFYSKFHIIEYALDAAGRAIPVDRGYVGPGTLSHEQLSELTKDLKSGKRSIPFVVEVEYAEIHEDTGKLQFGIIQRIRDDKAPSECIAEDA
jgi:hypothetical protein